MSWLYDICQYLLVKGFNCILSGMHKHFELGNCCPRKQVTTFCDSWEVHSFFFFKVTTVFFCGVRRIIVGLGFVCVCFLQCFMPNFFIPSTPTFCSWLYYFTWMYDTSFLFPVQLPQLLAVQPHMNLSRQKPSPRVPSLLLRKKYFLAFQVLHPSVEPACLSIWWWTKTIRSFRWCWIAPAVNIVKPARKAAPVTPSPTASRAKGRLVAA